MVLWFIHSFIHSYYTLDNSAVLVTADCQGLGERRDVEDSWCPGASMMSPLQRGVSAELPSQRVKSSMASSPWVFPSPRTEYDADTTS